MILSNGKEVGRKEFYQFKGKKWPVNADEKYKVVPMYVERLINEFEASQQLHKKVLFVRIDFESAIDDKANEPIEGLLRYVKSELRRQYRMKNIGHFWVREASRAKGVHWHLVLLLDGNLMQDSYTVTNWASHYWECVKEYGRVSIPRNCYLQIKDERGLHEAFYRASYLAKERSKFKTKGVKTFGTSKLKMK